MTPGAVHANEKRQSGSSSRRRLPLSFLLAGGALAFQGAVFDIGASALGGSKNGCSGETGTLSFACGELSHAYSDDNGIQAATAVGVASDAYGLNSSAFGALAEAFNDSTAVGELARAAGSDSVAVGQGSHAGGDLREGSVHNSGATAIGSGAQAGATVGGQDNATAIGFNAKANAANATALGMGATANFASSTAIGQGVTTTRANQVRIGLGTNTYTMSGLNSQASKAAQQGTAYMVTSDANGNMATASVNLDVLNGLDGRVTANTTVINQHTTQIASLNTTVGTHATQLADHETRIAGNTTVIGQHTTQIAALNTTVGTHATQLADHETRIAGNTTVIGQHTTQIAALDGRVTTLETGLGELGREIGATRREARQGIAAAIAMASAPMPSLAGRTSWVTNVGHFKGETAFGGALAHRLDLSDNPFAVTFGYSYGGSDSHAFRAGLMGEF